MRHNGRTQVHDCLAALYTLSAEPDTMLGVQVQEPLPCHFFLVLHQTQIADHTDSDDMCIHCILFAECCTLYCVP